MTLHGATLVVAARSARMMAEAAGREGFRVIALDVFGDADTRRASTAWHSIAAPVAGGAGGVPHIDAGRLHAALDAAAASHAPLGWIAGSDLDADPALLDAASRRLPLIGTAPADVQRVRDPRAFLGALDALGLAHPETRFDAPTSGGGWLRKLPGGCGGWHIRRHAPCDAPEPLAYFQRESPGRPMSALFVAGLADDERGALRHRLVGLHDLIVRPFGAYPHVFRGAIGPITLPAAAMQAIGDAIDALVGRFGLRGLCSLDFLWHAGRAALLEINPRPSASMALHPQRPLIAWHLRACGLGLAEPIDAGSRRAQPLRGIETVFARRAFELGAGKAAALAARTDCHDLPAPGTRFEAGDPVCSVSAEAADEGGLQRTLTAQRQALRAWLAA